MMIKKRLTISNIFMVIIPVVLIIIIALVMRIPFSKVYENKFSELREKENNAYYIQDRLRPDIPKIHNEEELHDLSIQLQNFLEPKGYHLIITYDKEIISSNLTESDNKVVSNMGDDLLFQARSLVLEMNGASLVKNSFKEQDKIINIIAVNSSYIPRRMDIQNDIKSFTDTFMATYVGIVVIISVIIITLTNAILSSRVARSLIVPLELLSYGSEQIKEGNLDFEMNYESDDEFGRVCSEFNEMRVRLKESIEKQLKYEDNRKQLIVGISHDLRTPLTVIKGYVQGIRDGVAKTPEKQKKYLDTIYTKACDMNSLVDRLFLFSKLDDDSFPFNFNRLDIRNYIKDFYDSIREEFYTKGIKLYFEDNCKNKIMIDIDAKEMNRVFVNILENSVKYKKDDIGNVKIKLHEQEDSVVLEFCDNGKSVSDDELSDIFVSFYRGDPSRTNSSEGSGLGLAIAKRIVRAHGGEITAHNINGFTIKIMLPKINKATL